MSDITANPRRAVVREKTAARPTPRVHVRGKFLFAGERKLYLRGVTYGTFAPDAAGYQKIFRRKRAIPR